MNYYIVRIGKLSSKSKGWIYQPVEVYVSSDKPLSEIEDYYKKKYSGFDVDVKAISFETLQIEFKKEEQMDEQVAKQDKIIKRESLKYPYYLEEADSEMLKEKYEEMEDLKRELKTKIRKDILEKCPYFQDINLFSDFYFDINKRRFAIKFNGFYKYAFEEYLEQDQIMR